MAPRPALITARSQWFSARLPAGAPFVLPSRGTTFVHRHAGSGSGPTILLLHGWTVTGALNWFPHFAALGELGPVVSIDHRGHGRGIRPDGPFLLTAAADDAAALIDALGTGPVVAVGYSMGGTIAQLLARRRPDLVAGLVARHRPKALLLECTNLPPYKPALAARFGLEIFDILTLIDSVNPDIVDPAFL